LGRALCGTGLLFWFEHNFLGSKYFNYLVLLDCALINLGGDFDFIPLGFEAKKKAKMKPATSLLGIWLGLIYEKGLGDYNYCIFIIK